MPTDDPRDWRHHFPTLIHMIAETELPPEIPSRVRLALAAKLLAAEAQHFERHVRRDFDFSDILHYDNARLTTEGECTACKGDGPEYHCGACGKQIDHEEWHYVIDLNGEVHRACTEHKEELHELLLGTP